MSHSVFILKCVATTALGIIFVILSLVVIAFVPMYMAIARKSNTKFQSFLNMIPLGIVAGLIVKIWKGEGMSDTERAYYDGIRQGQVKAAKKQGMIEGARMIAKKEDLSIKPVYSMRAVKSSQLKSTDPIPYS